MRAMSRYVPHATCLTQALDLHDTAQAGGAKMRTICTMRKLRRLEELPELMGLGAGNAASAERAVARRTDAKPGSVMAADFHRFLKT